MVNRCISRKNYIYNRYRCSTIYRIISENKHCTLQQNLKVSTWSYIGFGPFNKQFATWNLFTLKCAEFWKKKLYVFWFIECKTWKCIMILNISSGIHTLVNPCFICCFGLYMSLINPLTVRERITCDHKKNDIQNFQLQMQEFSLLLEQIKR